MMSRTHPRDAADTLRHSRRRPRYIEVDDYLPVLEVHAFAEQIRGKKKIDRLGARRRPRPICTRSKSCDRILTREFSTSNACSNGSEHGYLSGSSKAAKHLRDRGRVLSEGDDFRTCVRLADIAKGVSSSLINY
jgi:hypothetical protein